jgi:hypothetical protein
MQSACDPDYRFALAISHINLLVYDNLNFANND